MYYDFGAYDMKYDEIKEFCHKAWSERFNYLRFYLTKKLKVNIVFSRKGKPHILNVFPKVNLFDNIKVEFISKHRRV